MSILKFPAGSAVIFSSGDYSDRSNIATLIMLKECDIPSLVKKYGEEYPPSCYGYDAKVDRFPTWLIVQGYAMAADVQEVHLGGYSGFELDIDE
jgi:hypothetical protein